MKSSEKPWVQMVPLEQLTNCILQNLLQLILRFGPWQISNSHLQPWFDLRTLPVVISVMALKYRDHIFWYDFNTTISAEINNTFDDILGFSCTSEQRFLKQMHLKKYVIDPIICQKLNERSHWIVDINSKCLNYNKRVPTASVLQRKCLGNFRVSYKPYVWTHRESWVTN